MGKYFGTDGFRGEANVNLTFEHAVKIGSRLCRGKGPHIALRGESPGFRELRPDTWSFSRIATRTSGNLSCCLRKVKSPFEF